MRCLFDELQQAPVDLEADRLAESIHLKDQAVLGLHSVHDPLNPLEGAGDDLNPIAFIEERMGQKVSIPGEGYADILDLPFELRLVFDGDQVGNMSRPIRQVRLLQAAPQEDVTGEEGDFDRSLTASVISDLLYERQEIRNLHGGEVSRQLLFPPAQSVKNVPFKR